MDYWKIFLILFITIILLNKSSICNSMLGGNQTPTAPTLKNLLLQHLLLKHLLLQHLLLKHLLLLLLLCLF